MDRSRTRRLAKPDHHAAPDLTRRPVSTPALLAPDFPWRVRNPETRRAPRARRGLLPGNPVPPPSLESISASAGLIQRRAGSSSSSSSAPPPRMRWHRSLRISISGSSGCFASPRRRSGSSSFSTLVAKTGRDTPGREAGARGGGTSGKLGDTGRPIGGSPVDGSARFSLSGLVTSASSASSGRFRITLRRDRGGFNRCDQEIRAGARDGAREVFDPVGLGQAGRQRVEASVGSGIFSKSATPLSTSRLSALVMATWRIRRFFVGLVCPGLIL